MMYVIYETEGGQYYTNMNSWPNSWTTDVDMATEFDSSSVDKYLAMIGDEYTELTVVMMPTPTSSTQYEVIKDAATNEYYIAGCLPPWGDIERAHRFYPAISSTRLMAIAINSGKTLVVEHYDDSDATALTPDPKKIIFDAKTGEFYTSSADVDGYWTSRRDLASEFSLDIAAAATEDVQNEFPGRSCYFYPANEHPTVEPPTMLVIKDTETGQFSKEMEGYFTWVIDRTMASMYTPETIARGLEAVKNASFGRELVIEISTGPAPAISIPILNNEKMTNIGDGGQGGHPEPVGARGTTSIELNKPPQYICGSHTVDDIKTIPNLEPWEVMKQAADGEPVASMARELINAGETIAPAPVSSQITRFNWIDYEFFIIDTSAQGISWWYGFNWKFFTQYGGVKVQSLKPWIMEHPEYPLPFRDETLTDVTLRESPLYYWTGGPCPVPSNVEVEIICRDLSTCIDRSDVFSWDLCSGGSADIIAFKLTGRVLENI